MAGGVWMEAFVIKAVSGIFVTFCNGIRIFFNRHKKCNVRVENFK